jgi:hypothetical protein
MSDLPTKQDLGSTISIVKSTGFSFPPLKSVGNMRLKMPDFNLRQNINKNATAISNRIEN